MADMPEDDEMETELGVEVFLCSSFVLVDLLFVAIESCREYRHVDPAVFIAFISMPE
jgi:hypothetical protein